ncbi:MAG: hypothetical protein LAO09_21605 [Acidobacteriia bacterium]|nr:hypothetical protein [Terriglobia bacterium]
MGKFKKDARRSTRLSLQIPVEIASLDPTCNFREECQTAVVNAQGCGVIVHRPLDSETPIVVKLISSGASKKARVVGAIPMVKTGSWLLGVAFDSPENFWQVDRPPADWCV